MREPGPRKGCRAFLLPGVGAIDTPDRITHPKKRAFLAAYAKCGIIGTAARLAGISRFTYYAWMEHDEAFAAQVGQAKADAADLLEEEALQRATVGRPAVKEVYEDGVLVKREVTEGVSDTLLIFLLKGAKPEKFRDRLDVNHSGTVVKAVDREFWEAV